MSINHYNRHNTTTEPPTPTQQQQIQLLKDAITEHPNFPKPNILFYNILPVLQSPTLHHILIIQCIQSIQLSSVPITHICAIEARGYLIGCTLSYLLQLPFIPIRKYNKLPLPVYTQQYELEYGSDVIQIQCNTGLDHDSNVCIVDDLLATGGTLNAAINLISQTNASVIQCLCIVELLNLMGRQYIGKQHKQSIQIQSIIQYEQ